MLIRIIYLLNLFIVSTSFASNEFITEDDLEDLSSTSSSLSTPPSSPQGSPLIRSFKSIKPTLVEMAFLNQPVSPSVSPPVSPRSTSPLLSPPLSPSAKIRLVGSDGLLAPDVSRELSRKEMESFLRNSRKSHETVSSSESPKAFKPSRRRSSLSDAENNSLSQGLAGFRSPSQGAISEEK